MLEDAYSETGLVLELSSFILSYFYSTLLEESEEEEIARQVDLT